MILIKTEEQIHGIRKSCQLAADTLEYVGGLVKPGVTTLYLNDKADEYIRDHHATPAPLKYKGFPKSICTSINEVVCHGIPSGTAVLKDGDVVNIDVTTILNGYYGDTSAMFKVGQVKDSALKLLAVAKDCLDMGICMVRPDTPFYKIAETITTYAHSRGYSVVEEFCGHGVGVKFHEEPAIVHSSLYPEKETRLMQPGMVFTIEPMINEGLKQCRIRPDKWTAVTIDGKLSAQYEHTVLVTEYGVEVLTV